VFPIRFSEAMTTTRRHSLVLLGAALAVALALVTVLVVAGSGGGDETSPTAERPAAAGKGASGARDAAAVLKGIPQDGIALGRPDAPVTLVEFADLQCPFCRDYALQVFPLVVRDYVASGKVRVEFRDLAFLGPDSTKAARAAAAAGAQDKLWNFVDAFYANQGEENSGYVTDAFVDRLFRAIPGLDVAKAKAAAARGAGAGDVDAGRRLADRHGIDGTPAFLYGRTGGRLKPLKSDSLTFADFRAALDPLVGR
jgi:protein-disulfide isomerase